MRCLRCQAQNLDGRRFCGECGAPLRPVEGERRQVTVLFADVVGFTALSERFDPEVVHELMDGCCAVLGREVGRYGGRVSAFTGDGVMAVFGAPRAEEDHAARAVHAALAIQEGLGLYAEDVHRRFGIEFRMRIGVNTGLVLAGGLDDGGAAAYTVLGDTVNLASRLESAASPGGVLAGESTRRSAGEAFRWQPVGSLQLKGKAEPVDAWEPVAASEGSRFELLAQRGLTTFVGRQAELDALMAAWERAAAGAGQIVSVVGEAGLGKSRLLHEFKTEMAKRESPLFEGSCFTYGDAISYLPFLDLVRGILGIDPTTPAEEIEAILETHLAGRGLASAAPYLRHLLGLDPSDDVLAHQSPSTVRQHMLEALSGLILGEAGGAPTAIVVEDVHWIDTASEEVLSAVVESMAALPLLVVLVYRPEYLRSWGDVAYHAELSLDRLGGASSAAMVQAILSKSYATNVPLEGLSPEDSRAMVRWLLGTTAVPEELERLIETHTDGNPLFIEELTRHLMEAGYLVPADDGYAVTSPPEGQALPTTVQGVLLARIDRLNPELRGLLQVASVLGRVFPHQLVGAMTELDGGLNRALLQLEDLDFIYLSALAPERQYSFKHVLTQEAVYQTLVRSRREAHHERAGQVIEALYGDRLDEWVEILAHHYTRSGNNDKALDYLALAHRKASRTCAVVEAEGYFDESMRILDRAPDTPANEHRRISMVANQFLVAMWLNKLPAYFELADRYRDVAGRLEDPVARRWFDLRRAQGLWWNGFLDDAIRELGRIIESWEADGHLEGAANTYSWLMWTHLTAANYDAVASLKVRALEVFEQHFDPLHYTWTRTAAAWVLVQQGAWAEAIEEAEAGLRVGEEHGNDSLISFSAFVLCMAYTEKGQMDEALRYGGFGLSKAPTPVEQIWTLSAISQTWSRTGQAEQTVEALAPVAPLYVEANFLLGIVWGGTNLGEAYLRAGRLAEAAGTLAAVVDVAESKGARFYLGSALRFLGEVTRQADPSAHGQQEAAAHFERSMAVLTEIGARNELAHAHAGCGRLHRDRGDGDEARRHLTRALEIFGDLGTLGEPDAIRKELVELG